MVYMAVKNHPKEEDDDEDDSDEDDDDDISMSLCETTLIVLCQPGRVAVNEQTVSIRVA